MPMYSRPTRRAAMPVEERRAALRPPLNDGLLVAVVSRCQEILDLRVRLRCQFRQRQQVVAAEAVRSGPLAVFAFVPALERHAVESAVFIRLAFPDLRVEQSSGAQGPHGRLKRLFSWSSWSFPFLF
jgi:hypothetical protein